MQNFEFIVESKDQGSGSVQSNNTDSPQINEHLRNSVEGIISVRTSPRVRYTIENRDETVKSIFSPSADQGERSRNAERLDKPNFSKPDNNQNVNPKPGQSLDRNDKFSAQEKAESKIDPSAVSELFFSTLDTLKSSGNRQGNVRNRTIKGSIRSHNRQETNEPRSTVDNFNPFLKTEQTKISQSHTERSSSPKQRYEPNKDNKIIRQDVAGGNHFNVQRPVRDVNERVPSRAEALVKIQEQYEIQRAEFEAKKREKEAKKREEFLARYKHVDQGYRLNSDLLDEAAGYAQNYNKFETEENVRQRQQEKLRQDALAYQKFQRQEQERQKRMEEKKVKEKLKKNRHVDAGYRLGHGESQETETEEDALQRQEEQLILEMLIQEQMELQAQKKLGTEHRDNVKRLKDNPSSSANSASMNPFLSAKQTSKTANAGSPSSNNTPRQHYQSAGLPSLVSENAISNYSKENDNEHTEKQGRSNERNIQIKVPNPPTELYHFEAKTQNKNPQIEEHDSKASRNFVSPVPDLSQVSGSEPFSKKPSSCVLKNPNGAVLVLRPTPQDLNQALVRRLEVQDEIDKHGYSAQYEPTLEQAPVFSNNRFERKPGLEPDVHATGAIPKNITSSAVKPVSSPAAAVPTNSKAPEQDMPSFDHKEELRAARLKFQQQYEEALKKKLEQKNDS